MRVSQASADQRRGRAGRLEPGICYRLAGTGAARVAALHAARDPRRRPGAAGAGAGGLGHQRAASLPWLTPPPAASLATRALLADLGAIDASGAITAHGRAMVRLGQHPRIAHLVLKGRELGQGEVAALLTPPSWVSATSCACRPASGDADLRHRVDIALSGRRDGTLRLIQESARRLMPRDASDERPDIAMTGPLLALAYPDTSAAAGPARPAAISVGRPWCGLTRRRSDGQRGVPGRGRSRWLGAGVAAIFLAAPITAAEIEELYADRIVDEQLVQWSARDGAVLARRRRRLGALALEDKPLSQPDPEKVRAAMLEGVRQARARRPALERRPRALARAHRLPAPSCGRVGPICRMQPCWRHWRSGLAPISTVCRAGIISRASTLVRH